MKRCNMSDFQYFMIPGPTQLPPDVLGALGAPMVNHRGPEFKEIMDKIHSNLQTIYKTKNDIITLNSGCRFREFGLSD